MVTLFNSMTFHCLHIDPNSQYNLTNGELLKSCIRFYCKESRVTTCLIHCFVCLNAFEMISTMLNLLVTCVQHIQYYHFNWFM